MDEWIDVKKKLPPDKTWVEAIHCVPGTNFTWEQEWFYWSAHYEFDRMRITHWRFITHPFFNSITNDSIAIELK